MEDKLRQIQNPGFKDPKGKKESTAEPQENLSDNEVEEIEPGFMAEKRLSMTEKKVKSQRLMD
jgi:hypothetical protein